MAQRSLPSGPSGLMLLLLEFISGIKPLMQDHFHMIRSELLDYQRKRAILEMKEAELEGQLSTHNAEFEAVVVDVDDHDAMREKLVRV